MDLRRIAKTPVLLGVMSLFSAGCHSTPEPLDPELLISESSQLDELSWMNGSWVSMDSRGIRSEEHWAPAAGGVMMGMHRTVRGNGGEAFVELMTIKLSEVGVTFWAEPAGRDPVPFYLAEQEAYAVTFSNPEHDYPKVIRYWLGEDGLLHAEISGETRGQAMREAYAWRPAKIAR